MGLVSGSPVRTFLETNEAVCVESQAEILLSAFFEAMHTTAVHMSLGPGLAVKAFLEFKTENPPPMSVEYLEALAKPVKHEVLPASIAARQGAIRMAELARPPGITTGISFGLDQDPLSPKKRWLLMFHRGALPLLELSISDQVGFKPPPDWTNSLIKSGAAHIISANRAYIGSADHLYLFLKRNRIFPYSKGDSSAEAVLAGQSLQQFCREIASGQAVTTQRLSFWRWKQKRFLRRFDRALLTHVGTDKLSTILKAMGTSPDEWFL